MKKLSYLVGVDGSGCSLRAVQRAVNIAELTNANITVLYVLDSVDAYPLTMEGYIPPAVDKNEQYKSIQKNILDPIINAYPDFSGDIVAEISEGDPVDEISKRIKEIHANMLFVGRKGRSRVIDLLLGSVANKLAHYVGVPIVLVP